MNRAKVGLLVVAALVTCWGSRAQEAGRIVLDAVEIKGLSRVNESLVRSQIEIKPGDPLDPRAVARDIGRIMKLGFFATISADIDQSGGRNVLAYTVAEEQTIREIRIAGNKKLKERQIRGAIQWREGASFYREAYGEERDALQTLYRSKGFMNATVDIVVEPIAPGEVRITYVIDEGRKAKINDIQFIGNEALSDSKLKRTIKTRKRFLFLGGRYDQDKFEADLAAVLNAYGDVGRLEAAIPSTEFNYSPNGKKLGIEIAVAEGPEYHVESLDFAENNVFTYDELMPFAQVKAGDVHNRSRVTADAADIQRLYRTSGYINATAAPLVTLNREKHTTAVTHQVREDELKFIKEVRITGNTITRDEVVRRNIDLKPGERFDGSLYERTQRRLEGAGYFAATRLTLSDVEENDRFTNLLVDVEEGKTGDFNFGGAFNTDEGIGGFAELRLRNFDIMDFPTFSGGGQVFAANAFIGTSRSSYRVGLTDPEFLGYPFSLGIEFFDESFTGTGSSDYTTEQTGANIRLGKRLSAYNSGSITLSYRDTSVEDLDTFVDPELRELEDPGSTLSIAFGFNRNTSNSNRDPTKGAIHGLDLEIADFGLDNDFVGLHHESTLYYGIARYPKVSFSLRARDSIMFPFGDREFVPITERLFAGGTGTIRGYDFRDVGPRADTFRIEDDGSIDIDDEPIGGELRLIQSFEAKYKLTDIFRLYYFIDAGAVFFKPEDFDFGDWKFGTGVGIGVDVPFLGPLRLDYGIPLNPNDDQGSGQIHIQSSVRF